MPAACRAVACASAVELALMSAPPATAPTPAPIGPPMVAPVAAPDSAPEASSANIRAILILLHQQFSLRLLTCSMPYLLYSPLLVQPCLGVASRRLLRGRVKATA